MKGCWTNEGDSLWDSLALRCRGGSVEVRGGGAGDPSLKLCGEDERLHPPAVLYSDSGTATITYHSLSIPPTNPPVPSPSYRPANALSPPSDPLVPSTSTPSGPFAP
ncbi:hypothetical protein Pcinc_033813 [Petrolisthes cinctipes]|uniref:Uncharacterized protein n=1 Tax=Petrolisthes cinctipes TaxID=88211 RepID=A0AAE1JWR1_PETCI|nr:hypothetical protein Pcinc_033813 [Petrolisthes cinctipes]